MVEGFIIGNGDIASALKDVQTGERGSMRYLASGLSNSQKVMYCDLVREKNLIRTWSNNHVVYFSSLCVYYANSDYAHYKKELEEYVKQTCKHWTIVRIGNITWGDNPNTLLNYLKAHPEAERRDEVRYLVDKEEFLHWVGKIRPYVNDIINIPGKMVNVKDLKV